MVGYITQIASPLPLPASCAAPETMAATREKEEKEVARDRTRAPPSPRPLDGAQGDHQGLWMIVWRSRAQSTDRGSGISHRDNGSTALPPCFVAGAYGCVIHGMAPTLLLAWLPASYSAVRFGVWGDWGAQLCLAGHGATGEYSCAAVRVAREGGVCVDR